jgi:acyl dehydratase
MYDEIAVGHREELGSHTFTAEAIIAFALKYDPQPFHIDEEAARKSHFGGLIASGWQTGGVWMRLRVDSWKKLMAEREAKGLPLKQNGPSSGFTNLAWLKPVYAGDTVTYASEVTAKRLLATRPGWGVVMTRNTGINQKGDLVFAFDGSVFMPR